MDLPTDIATGSVGRPIRVDRTTLHTLLFFHHAATTDSCEGLFAEGRLTDRGRGVARGTRREWDITGALGGIEIDNKSERYLPKLIARINGLLRPVLPVPFFVRVEDGYQVNSAVRLETRRS